MARIHYAGEGLRPIRSLPVHHHEPWIVITYTFGRGSVIFEDETLSFRRGTIVCVPPRMPYAERSVRGFNSAFIAVDRLTLKSRPARFDDDGTVLPLARLIIRTFNRGQPRLSAIAGQLFDALSSWLEFQSGSAANPHVEALKELIHQHWSDPEFNLEHASRRIPLSPAHLRRTFAAELKLPPVRYLQEYRIAQARRLLAIGGYSIKEISQMCGFSDPYYFSRAFRKLEGKSPVHWKVQRPNT